MIRDRSLTPRSPEQATVGLRRRYAAPAALWLIAAAIFIFSAFLAHFYDRFPGDERLTDALQRVDVPALGGYLAFVNALGNVWLHAALVVGVALLLGLMRAGWESLLALYTFVPSLLNGVVKDWVARPRPSEELVNVPDSIAGFSFPSGHTVSTAALFIVLFFAVSAVVRHRGLRWLLQAGCLLMVVSAGAARVYIGVHWPSDAIAGYLLMALLLVPLLYVYVARRSPGSHSK
ncbi:MAG: phosphatase PAP2 family protein [Chloroflexi bacterium]|nr:phosphatase PAP2 family protein [Chloroflexota bacterium]